MSIKDTKHEKTFEESLYEFNTAHSSTVGYDAETGTFFDYSKENAVRFPDIDVPESDEESRVYDDDITSKLDQKYTDLREIIIEKTKERITHDMILEGLVVLTPEGHRSWSYEGKSTQPILWDRIKEKLNKYNILWYSPADENPTLFGRD